MSLKSILNDPELRAATVDALSSAYLPLLKDAAQTDLLDVLFLAKRVIAYRASGDSKAAEIILNTINLIVENVAIEAKYETQELIAEAIPALIVGIVKAAAGAVIP